MPRSKHKKLVQRACRHRKRAWNGWDQRPECVACRAIEYEWGWSDAGASTRPLEAILRFK